MSSRPFVLTIDVEPDGIFLRDPSEASWSGFEAGVREMQRLRDRFAATQDRPVQYSWKLRMDRQVEAAFGTPAAVLERNPGVFASLAAAGDDIGLHVHPFRREQDGTWVADFADGHLVAETIRSAHQAYCAAFGGSPRAASMGHNWQSTETVALFETLGIQVDLSLEHGTRKPPFYDGIGRFEGLRPSFEPVPAHPFHPATHDVRTPGDEKATALWMHPLASVWDAGLGERRKIDLRDGPAPLRHLLDGPLEEAPCPAVAVRSSDFGKAEHRTALLAALEFLADRNDVELVTPLDAIAGFKAPGEPADVTGAKNG